MFFPPQPVRPLFRRQVSRRSVLFSHSSGFRRCSGSPHRTAPASTPAALVHQQADPESALYLAVPIGFVSPVARFVWKSSNPWPVHGAGKTSSQHARERNGSSAVRIQSGGCSNPLCASRRTIPKITFRPSSSHQRAPHPSSHKKPPWPVCTPAPCGRLRPWIAPSCAHTKP